MCSLYTIKEDLIVNVKRELILDEKLENILRFLKNDTNQDEPTIFKKALLLYYTSVQACRDKLEVVFVDKNGEVIKSITGIV